jgi:hypothetical protein
VHPLILCRRLNWRRFTVTFSEEYLPKWDKLTHEWVRILYENANKNIQAHIEKFIDPKRIETIGYFDYFDIRHSDPRFKHLGEFIKDFNKTFLNFRFDVRDLEEQRYLFYGYRKSV